MNVLFLSLGEYQTIYKQMLYPDLLRKFVDYGHHVYMISPYVMSNGETDRIIEEPDCTILKIGIVQMQKAGYIKKLVSMLTIDNIYIRGIKKYFANIKFNLIMYPTPPISFVKVVAYVKQRDNAKSYLLLKDIFPQNAVDLGMMSKKGIKSLIYRFFRNKEKKLYAVSDFIGCMSPANVDYVLDNNPDIKEKNDMAAFITGDGIVEVCPNSYNPLDMRCGELERVQLRKKYGIPVDSIVYVYGGNLGKPQGVDFLIECLKEIIGKDVFFLIVGNGTEYEKLARFMEERKPNNVRLMKRLPKDEYDTMIGACDVGLIFLDYRFTIPNFPSRLLSYMQAHLPVLACTDPNTDIGQVIVKGGFGWWCPSNDVDGFIATVQAAMQADRKAMGESAWDYFKDHYDVEIAYKTIMSHFEKEQSMDV